MNRRKLLANIGVASIIAIAPPSLAMAASAFEKPFAKYTIVTYSRDFIQKDRYYDGGVSRAFFLVPINPQTGIPLNHKNYLMRSEWFAPGTKEEADGWCLAVEWLNASNKTA